MAKKSLQDLKTRIFLLSSELSSLIEDANMDEDVRSELEDIVDEMSLRSTLKIVEDSAPRAKNGQFAKRTAKTEENAIAAEERDATELASFCRSVASDLDVIIQANDDMDNGIIERLEGISNDMTVIARQLKQVATEKKEEKEQMQKVSARRGRTASLMDFNMFDDSVLKSVKEEQKKGPQINTLDKYMDLSPKNDRK